MAPEAAKRLERVRQEHGSETLKDFWKALTKNSQYDVSYEAVRTYHSSREPPAHYYARVADVTGARLEWLITGRGEAWQVDAEIAQRTSGEVEEGPGAELAGKLTAVSRELGLPSEVEFCVAQFLWRLYTGGALLSEEEEFPGDKIPEERIREDLSGLLGPALGLKDRGPPAYAAGVLAQLSVAYLRHL